MSKKFRPNIQTIYNDKNIKNPTKYFNRTFDSKLSIKRKNSSKDRKRLEVRIHNTLVGVNCAICMVPVKRIKLISKKPIRKIKNFTNKCTLDFSTKRYNQHDLMFRRKFASLITSKILLNEKKIYKKLSKHYQGNKIYNTYRMIKDHELMNSYMKFILNIISYDDMDALTESLFDMYYILNDKNISNNIMYYRKKIYKYLNKSHSHIFGKKSYKLLCNIFNMSALLCIGNSKSCIFSYRHFKGTTMDDDLGNMIYKLGKTVIKYHISDMFEAYLQCNPKVRTMYFKEVSEKDEMMVGVMALSFVSFIFKSTDIHYIIRNLIRRPWTYDGK